MPVPGGWEALELLAMSANVAFIFRMETESKRPRRPSPGVIWLGPVPSPVRLAGIGLRLP
jgi:hypothetical protein